LATELRDGERAISLVSGSVDALPRNERAHLLCVTDQGLLLASFAGGSARRFDYGELESFSSRNSNPGSYALGLVTLGVLKSLSCQYVLRIQDGQRVTLSNIRPERRGFTVARRIEFYRRRSNLPRMPAPEAIQEAAAAAKQQVGRLADRVREAARSTSLADWRRPRPRRAQSHRSSVTTTSRTPTSSRTSWHSTTPASSRTSSSPRSERRSRGTKRRRDRQPAAAGSAPRTRPREPA
jgi:hypothetical protein